MNRAMSAAGLTLRVLIETDIGMERVGVAPGEATWQLAQRIRSLPGLRLAGIMGYEGHLLRIAQPEEKASRIREALGRLVQTRDLLESHGIACPIVSCGGTGSFSCAVKQAGITELQAGGGIFMDAFYRHSCQVTQWNYALSVLTTIVSRPAPERAVIDAGRKTMNVEDSPGDCAWPRRHRRSIALGRTRDTATGALRPTPGYRRPAGDHSRLQRSDVCAARPSLRLPAQQAGGHLVAGSARKATMRSTRGRHRHDRIACLGNTQ